MDTSSGRNSKLFIPLRKISYSIPLRASYSPSNSILLIFATDYRTLLVLMLGLPIVYDTLIQIWSTMPDRITREKALRILRTEDKRMMDRDQDVVGLLSHTRGAKRKARGELTQGENSKRPSSWPTYQKCQRQHPGGHPDYRCHDREREGEKSQNQSPALLAIQASKEAIRGIGPGIFTPAFDFD
ncbi:hypothetical protein F5882DRAFT_413501 [Hyaloscypha sp. PMI_1271]|nr:hypothetical protein F5882DRAFT_413501 [Hyaloscypha sp. PMI_1271]